MFIIHPAKSPPPKLQGNIPRFDLVFRVRYSTKGESKVPTQKPAMAPVKRGWSIPPKLKRILSGLPRIKKKLIADPIAKPIAVGKTLSKTGLPPGSCRVEKDWRGLKSRGGGGALYFGRSVAFKITPYQPKVPFSLRLRICFSSAQTIWRVCTFTAFRVNL